jgi:hypothetical protein
MRTAHSDGLPLWILAFLCVVLVGVGAANRWTGNVPQAFAVIVE